MIIGIDKGHTLYNGGCCGAIGLLNESIENRKVGDLLIKKLRDLGHTVIDCSCDYATDVNKQLQAIVDKANSQNLDLFLSLHLNSYDGSAKGVEIHTTETSSAKAKADELLNAYIEKTRFKNRGHKYSNLYVLRNTIAPAMLLEMCFVDSKEDYSKWIDLGADFIANTIAEGITGQKDMKSYTVTNLSVKRSEGKLLSNCKNNVVVYGSRGKYVTLLQSILTVLGYNPNGIDGHCGAGCVAAIKNYQRDHGLTVDGSCGPATWTSLLS